MDNSSVKSMCRVESDYMIRTENLDSVANQFLPYNGGIFNVVTLYNSKYLHSITINIILNVIYNLILSYMTSDKNLNFTIKI